MKFYNLKTQRSEDELTAAFPSLASTSPFKNCLSNHTEKTMAILENAVANGAGAKKGPAMTTHSCSVHI
jgi:hypothetical protein